MAGRGSPQPSPVSVLPKTVRDAGTFSPRNRHYYTSHRVILQDSHGQRALLHEEELVLSYNHETAVHTCHQETVVITSQQETIILTAAARKHREDVIPPSVHCWNVVEHRFAALRRFAKRAEQPAN